MRKNCILLVFLILAFTAKAQRPFFKELRLDVQNDKVKANTLFQSADGLIYVGTDQGLYIYDGFDFDLFDLPEAISSQNVSVMAQVGKEDVYVCMSSGEMVSIRNNKAVTVKSPVKSPVKSMFQTVDGTLWMATYGEGIFYRKGSDWHRLSGIPDPFVYHLEPHPSGLILAGTDGGLLLINPLSNPISYHIYDSKKGLPDNIVKSIGVHPDGSVLLGLQEEGLCTFDLKSKKFTKVERNSGWHYGPVNCMMRLQNEFWVGTDGYGIVDYEFGGDRRLRHFGHENGFAYNKVNAILRDSEGNLWVAADNKLIFSPGEKVEFVDGYENYRFDSLQAITTSQDGYVWFSNPKGLFRFDYLANDNNRVRQYKIDRTLEQLHIVSLFEDKFGYLWVGTFDNGLYRLEPETGKVRRYSAKDGLKNANVISINGRDSVLWLATLGGVVRCTLKDSQIPGKEPLYLFDDFSGQEGSYDGFVYCVFIDSKGRAWFGTDGKGLVMYSEGKFSFFPELNGGKVVYSITEDARHNIWFSTQHNGLYRFDGLHFRNFNLSHGLSELDISGISTDNNGNIIVVNTNSLDVINPLSFMVETIGEESGIGKIDADLNTVTRDRKGGIWIGARKGLFRYFNYDKGISNRPRLILRGVYTFMKQSVDPKDSVFDYNQNNISIEYTGLWFTHPDLVSYRYRLKGYSNTWIPTSDRIVTFPNLPPGRYTFEVISGLGGQFRSDSLLSYSFRIRKPLWKENWFLSLCIGLFGLALIFYIRDRDLRLRRMENLKKEKVEYQFATLKSQVNPHFLFNSFNTLIAIIEDDKEKAISYVEKLSDYFRNMVQHRDKDIISLGEELEMVETYYFLQQKRFGEYLQLNVEVPEQWKRSFGLPPLALQLLIENAVKHNAVSHETPLFIRVATKGENTLVISNNLNPKRQPEPSTGIGLENIISRFQIISGHEVLVQKSQDNHFIVEVPLIKLKHENSDR
ncbi:MAG: histidine kinase [Bacteroidia bacterium]|nr:histidine kinase [Bacteroidia bacterium]